MVKKITSYAVLQSSSSGTFWVVLGSKKNIGGIDAHSVLITDDTGSYNIRWKYLATFNNQLIGSENEIALK